MSNGEVNRSMPSALFWSKRSDVAYVSHAPDFESERWRTEGWCVIPDAASRRHGLAYQCPRCAPNGRLHRHLHAADRGVNGVTQSA